VEKRSELRASLDKALTASGPCVLDVAIDPEINKPEFGVAK
jgi:acetolactate synthase I/II/III large subunit